LLWEPNQTTTASFVKKEVARCKPWRRNCPCYHFEWSANRQIYYTIPQSISLRSIDSSLCTREPFRLMRYRSDIFSLTHN